MIQETSSLSLQKTKFELAGDENWKRFQVNEEISRFGALLPV